MEMINLDSNKHSKHHSLGWRIFSLNMLDFKKALDNKKTVDKYEGG
jgi:hypothetical protein